ncbi:hypothetical protein PSCICF_09060 [Pseudomonas cichorii]|nr:hypothetical protein PSCICF_09060 [Pseudomonas cichorii]GFM60598.1 hypothetical protein PSCICG_17580 [Pseudomonas cichorii]
MAISKTYKFINQQRSILDVVWHTQAYLSAMSIGFQVGNELQLAKAYDSLQRPRNTHPGLEPGFSFLDNSQLISEDALPMLTAAPAERSDQNLEAVRPLGFS